MQTIESRSPSKDEAFYRTLLRLLSSGHNGRLHGASTAHRRIARKRQSRQSIRPRLNRSMMPCVSSSSKERERFRGNQCSSGSSGLWSICDLDRQDRLSGSDARPSCGPPTLEVLSRAKTARIGLAGRLGLSLSARALEACNSLVLQKATHASSGITSPGQGDFSRC